MPKSPLISGKGAIVRMIRSQPTDFGRASLWKAIRIPPEDWRFATSAFLLGTAPTTY